MRIGILGGTFDPIHTGHLALAEAARASLELDEVLFVPAHRNPLKADRRQASARHRLAMVGLALQDRPGFAVSDIEVQRGGPSYAIETLQELTHVRPADYWFLLGADALREIERWKQPDRLVRLCRLGVAIRMPETVEDVLSRLKPEFRERADPIELAPVEISSTEIRERLAKKQAVSLWVPPAVLQYIRENRLYEN